MFAAYKTVTGKIYRKQGKRKRLFSEESLFFRVVFAFVDA
jgi:hypothetical protein